MIKIRSKQTSGGREYFYPGKKFYSLRKLKNLHVNQHGILGSTAQVRTGWYQESHLGVKTTRNWDFIPMDDRLRSFHDYISYYAVVLPNEKQRGIL